MDSRLRNNQSKEAPEILFKFIHRQSREPYGEGFWGDRFRFLDYTGSRFIAVQESHLRDQLQDLGSVPLAGSLMNGAAPKSAAEFMRRVPLTSIEDYASELSALRISSHSRSYTWAYTQYGAGRAKWIPYTMRGLKVFTDNVVGALGMASTTIPADRVDIRPGARVVYNVPPRPYLAGIAAVELSRRFGLKGVIDPIVAEEMEFEERTRAELKAALATGVDLMISMTSVLRRISERFDEGLSSGSASSSGPLGMRATVRYLTARGKAKLSRRDMRPYDLWKPKAVLGWGLDTRYFSDQLAQDWGRHPFEMYASTETGSMGLQYRFDRGIALNPEVCFFEFLPESELESMRNDPGYTPKTALLPEVTTEGRYEVITTSFYGMPFVRYRTGHMVRFSAGQLGYGADLEYVGRADDRLDIGGFTRIDEATIWKAVSSSGLGVSDWIARRETGEGRPVLSLYAELNRPAPANKEGLAEELDAALVKSDPLYAELESMLGWKPLRVTLLGTGTFKLFYDEMRKAGEDLMARRPQRINAPDAIVDRLLALSRDIGERRAA